jgi:hypothetical protein
MDESSYMWSLYIMPIPALDESEREAVEHFNKEMEHVRALVGAGVATVSRATIGAVGAITIPIRGAIIAVIPSAIKAVVPALCTALGAWLHARSGRKVGIQIREFYEQAQTREEAEKLLARAQEIHQRNQQAKVIP